MHRIGRTARANNDGIAITFVSEKEQRKFRDIEKFLEKTVEKVPLPEVFGEGPEYHPVSLNHHSKGRNPNNRNHSQQSNRRPRGNRIPKEVKSKD